jgi:choline dehydrogenase
VCAGAYGSPAILLRSGIGGAGELRGLGIAPQLDLPGVGGNLQDHPVGGLMFAGTGELERRMSEFADAHWTPEEQTIAKARSTGCARGFDLHLFPIGGLQHGGGGWRWVLPFSCMTPRSRGAVRLVSSDPAVAPRIDHGYLSDPEGQDVRVLCDGLLLGEEVLPGAALTARADLAQVLTAFCMHYSHPVGTCRMGPARERAAVVDARGRVHGLDNAYVADASIMPIIPRANTNMPALVVGLRIAQWL